ncbi:DIP1984 family protein [Kineococcus endophyticus]|uniref:DIP1984 family protein n=1 Tax=Kineococcus endophyticus TaxID=1181883 RepID=A0ABV3P701_9ACTN
MKIAEALSERADAQRRVEQLRSRIAANARYQEGEEPAEDAAALLVEVGEVLTRLRTLIAQVNRTNSRVDLGPDGTMTDALATRDVLRLQHAVLTSAADAAAGQGTRHLRSELRHLSALPVADLRRQADEVARTLRTLDGRIQQANWTHDLLDWTEQDWTEG